MSDSVENNTQVVPGVGVSLFSFDDPLKDDVKPIKKAEAPTNIEPEETETSNEWLEHPNFENDYKSAIDNSTILPQCIESYKNNIAGFGIGVRYKEDYKGEEDKKMLDEFARANKVIELLTLESDTKKLFEQLVVDVESTGIAYLEIMRDNTGLPVEAENIPLVNSIYKSIRSEDRIPYTYYTKDGEAFTRKKRFRKYRQDVGGKTVYFKEFGDPRTMDKNTGKYVGEDEQIENENKANEILEYKFNSKPYGDIRWIGCMYPIVGSSYAESLNLNYFKNGRHTPLAICIENGRLTSDAQQKLAQYTNAIKGENGQHAFLVIEVEAIKKDLDWNKENPPKITIKDMASVLQKDELFGEYLDNNRRKAQSSFNLPDIYVGYTTDYNRSTVYAAMTVTEQQVFQPYRNNLDWLLNHKLFNEYNFKYVEFYFKAPELTNPEDVATILNATGPHGGVSPNLAKEITHQFLDKDCNDYDFDGADLPLQLALQKMNSTNIQEQLGEQILKAQNNGDDDIVPVLKAMLVEFKKLGEAADG